MFQAIIFDFDGVLALSEQPRFQVIQKSAANHNVIIPDELTKQIVGKTTFIFLNEILSEQEKPLIPRIIEEYEKEYKSNLSKYVKPVETTVEFIRNYSGTQTFALASMSSRRVIEELTTEFGIYEKFKSIVCREDVTHYKPHPEVYLKSANELKIEPSKCVVIEDTIIGAQAALSANMHCFVFLNGFNRTEEFAKLPIDGFISRKEDLENII